MILFNKVRKLLKDYIVGIGIFFFICVVLIYDFTTNQFSNPDFIGGVWVEFHGFLIEAILILIVLNYWNNYQEKKRLVPILHLILARIDHVELWIRVGFNRAVDLNHTPAENVKTIQFALSEIDRNLEKFVFLIDINSANLTSKITPQLIEIMETAVELKEKVQFVTSLLVEPNKKFDYILFSPLDDLDKLTINMNDLAAAYNYSYNIDRSPPSNNDIKKAWVDFSDINPLYDDPLSYEHRNHRHLNVFNVSTATKIKTNPTKDTILKTFKMH